MERRVTGNCHARCEAGEKREIISNSYLSLYEVRSFLGWYRHVTLVLLAAAYLVGICAQAHASCPVAALSMPVLLPLTVPEVRHLLARLIWPASSSTRRVLECRVVAPGASKLGQLLPYQTSSEGQPILVGVSTSRLALCSSGLVSQTSRTCPGSLLASVPQVLFPRKES